MKLDKLSVLLEALMNFGFSLIVVIFHF